MVETVTDLPAGTLGFRASGTISSSEYRQMMKPMYAMLERGEQLNIYFELPDNFHGLDLDALWPDLELRLFRLSEQDEARAWLVSG